MLHLYPSYNLYICLLEKKLSLDYLELFLGNSTETTEENKVTYE